MSSRAGARRRSQIGNHRGHSLVHSVGPDGIRGGTHVIVLDEKRAIVSGGLDLNVLGNAGQAKPPQAVVVRGKMAIHLRHGDRWECFSNPANDQVDVVSIIHDSKPVGMGLVLHEVFQVEEEYRTLCSELELRILEIACGYLKLAHFQTV